MDTKELGQKYDALKKYLDDYQLKINVDNAQQAVKEFDEQWKLFVDSKPNGDMDYGNALIVFSSAIFFNASENDCIDKLSKLIKEYDKHSNTKFLFGIKCVLFFNLGYCYHSNGTLYDNKAIEAFKKYVYYLIAQSNREVHFPIAYRFTKCSIHTYQSLINDQLNLSSPETFNDPFDCPIISVMDLPENKKEEINALIKKVYHDYVKIAALCCNFELGTKIKKHDNDQDEFLNTLLWAHYADDHKGICIKYRFNDSIPQLVPNDNVVAYFKDVRYSDDALKSYTTKSTMDLRDAFFLKGKPWEYENELRYLYFDLKSNSNYNAVDICCSIEAIYFGLNCSKKDKETIRRIMMGKKYVLRNKECKDVEFYQMLVDEQHFGRLKAVKLDTQTEP